jgi:hypothetical protein
VNHHLKQSISFEEQIQPLSEIIFALKVWSSLLLLGLMYWTRGEAALGFLNQAAYVLPPLPPLWAGFM